MSRVPNILLLVMLAVCVGRPADASEERAGPRPSGLSGLSGVSPDGPDPAKIQALRTALRDIEQEHARMRSAAIAAKGELPVADGAAGVACACNAMFDTQVLRIR